MPPCTMPKTSWPGACGASCDIFAQASVVATLCSARARSQGQGRHSSNTIAMSLPMIRWISIDSRGPRKMRRPSRCELNQQPSGVSVRIFASENTWKPPESVRMGLCQFMNAWRPPACAITSMPGRRLRW